MGQKAGKNLYDVLSEIASKYGVFLIIVLLFVGASAVAWVHSQTVPGEKVTLFGFDLYRKRPIDSPAPPAQAPNRDLHPVAPSNTPAELAPQPPPSKVECSGEGGLSSPTLPSAPPEGCVLIVEWWYPPKPTPCGIWIAATAVPSFRHNVHGHWWYVPPERVSPHIAKYKSKPNSVNPTFRTPSIEVAYFTAGPAN
jgi:hypothetical protein